uniref:Variant surface glycoprotein n=1 Tax=Trypanosoma brucei TaxID=5691 RepID=I7IV58_9TRYP|nr:variant surface glycoprotein [Trypanosoma brucei]
MTIGSLEHNAQKYCLSGTAKTGNGKSKLSGAGCRHGKTTDYSTGAGPTAQEVGTDGFTKITGKNGARSSGERSNAAYSYTKQTHNQQAASTLPQPYPCHPSDTEC